jgi:SH3-like domain-containing protein
MKPLLFAAVLLGAAAASAYPESFAPGIVTADNVNLRAEPNIRAEIVGQVHQDQPVEVIAMDGEWCAIVPPAGISGWISADYLREGVVTATRINIRAGPGVAYASLSKFQQGDRPEILETKEGWAKVVLPRNAQVWLNSRLVRLGEEAASIPRLSPSPVPETETPAAGEIVAIAVPVPSAPPVVSTPPPEQVAYLPAGGELAPAASGPSVPTPPAASAPIPATSVPSSAPASVDGPVKSYLGLLRALKQPYSSGRFRVTHELVRFEQRSEVIGHLAGGNFDLSKYQNRKVRLWAEAAPEDDPIPLLEVKGIQIMW